MASAAEVAVRREELRMLLQYAFRYALGRQSTAPADVQEAIRRHVGVLSLHDRVRIADEIEAAGPRLGHERIDAPGWRELAAWLRKEAGGG